MKTPPICPNCNRFMTPAGGVVGVPDSEIWACWPCNERVEDIPFINLKTNKK